MKTSQGCQYGKLVNISEIVYNNLKEFKVIRDAYSDFSINPVRILTTIGDGKNEEKKCLPI